MEDMEVPIIRVEDVQSASQVEIETKKYTCDVCNFQTSYNSNLHKHNRSPRHKEKVELKKIEMQKQEEDTENGEMTEISTIQRQKEKKHSKELNYKEKCTEQAELILELNKKFITLENNVEKKINDIHENFKQQIQTLTYNMDKKYKVLKNTILDMKGNIRVLVRVRPRTQNEVEQMKTLCSMNFIDEYTIEVGKGMDVQGIKQRFIFDRVFAPIASQEEIFEELSHLINSALEGYNVCIFTYGQTGSGKTYTMEGVIDRTVCHIFKQMKQFELLDGLEYRIKASFIEIHNERIKDLLDSQPKSHEIRMDSKGDLDITNLWVQEIKNPEELHEWVRKAKFNRTRSNAQSKSHAITKIRLIRKHGTKQEVFGNLILFDLSGCEREEAVISTETKNINKSLATLGNVISALTKKQEHIPYRDSKLTHLLMPSLGGNSRTLMLLNISPLDEFYNETLNSLKFAKKVMNCKTGNVKQSRMLLPNISN